MCGIFGVFGKYDEKRAFESLSLLTHRGPDSRGFYKDEKIFLGHTRLSIIDPGRRADQPMQREEITVVFNGEIYNYKELRLRLDFPFTTDSDTEVIIAAFKKWGVSFVNYLRGMFAIALYDGEKLYLFRDRFGKKPLFYAKDGDSFIFASEIKSIKSYLSSKIENKKALLCYLSYGTSVSPMTFYAGICKVLPASSLVYDTKNLEENRYYTFLNKPRIFEEKEALKHIEDHIKEAVEYRLVSDVEVGAFLSGGVDSSLVAAVAKKLENSLKTFSIGYKEYESYSELGFAKRVARHLDTDHHEIRIDRNDFFEALDDVIYHLDEPLADPAAVPLWHLSRFVHENGIKTVLSGDGGDELFMGYRQYFEFLDIAKAKELKYKNWLRNYFKKHFSVNKEWEWYKRVFEGSVLFRTSSEIFTDLQKNRLLKQNVKDNDSLEYIKRYIEEYENSGLEDEVSWQSFLDIKVHLGELYFTKLDRISMAHSLEVRTPLIDQKLVELSFSIDPKLKIGDGNTKYLLKKIASKYLPEDIVYRKKKGFSYPFIEWLNSANELERIRGVNKKAEIFKEEEIDFLLAQAQRGRFKQHAWALYIYCRWFEKEFL
ncbi:asparagine synthase (glutamine-hydrolyzing) [Nitrosophilus alvini]|uniref:asparagine synthase (glutamine-hydrolyzing) n=1 Tax=Nitrosophilus alvini TaxID=2714855 RepID=UPI001909EEF9|nr:asparagine synthase (glutamine-hydrolyzing) [Nitrosophilus alvini]